MLRLATIINSIGAVKIHALVQLRNSANERDRQQCQTKQFDAHVTNKAIDECTPDSPSGIVYQT